jgi:hypothetical protein
MTNSYFMTVKSFYYKLSRDNKIIKRFTSLAAQHKWLYDNCSMFHKTMLQH